jgi:hypothetical protein
MFSLICGRHGEGHKIPSRSRDQKGVTTRKIKRKGKGRGGKRIRGSNEGVREIEVHYACIEMS